MVHGLGSKEAENLLGEAGYQSGLVVRPTPCQAHRSSQLLGEDLTRIKGQLIPHHEIGRPGQLMRQGSMGRHEVGLGCFFIVVSPDLGIETASQTQPLRRRPRPDIYCRFFCSLSLWSFGYWSIGSAPSGSKTHSCRPWETVQPARFPA